MAGLILMLPFVSKIYKKLGPNKMLMTGASVLLTTGIIFLCALKQLMTPFIFCFLAGIGCGLTIVMINLNRTSVIESSNLRTAVIEGYYFVSLIVADLAIIGME